MNKQECKKYLKRAYKKIEEQNKSITPSNIEIEMRKQIKAEEEIYIAYSKMALHTLLHSATIITTKHLEEEIDTMDELYNEVEIIIKANSLPQIFSQVEKRTPIL